MIIVARIHNNSLGSCFLVNSTEEGIEKIKQLIFGDGTELSIEQIENLENDYEICFDSDPDNITTYSVGFVD